MSNDTENTRKPKEFMLTRLSLKFDKTLRSDYVVDSIEKAIYLVNDYLADSPNECLMGIALDSEKHPISACVIAVGDAHHIDSNYNNTFKFIFASNADSYLLVHNHPNSNSILPSDMDMQTFKELQIISSKLGVRFRDFIITGNAKQNHAYYSWSEEKIITQYDFLQRLKKVETGKTIEVTENSNRTPEETKKLLEESKYNSSSSSDSDSSKPSKGFFSIFK